MQNIYTMEAFLEEAAMVQGECFNPEFWIDQYKLYATEGARAGARLHDTTLVLMSPWENFQGIDYGFNPDDVTARKKSEFIEPTECSTDIWDEYWGDEDGNPQ